VVDQYVRIKEIVEFYNEEIHEKIVTKSKIVEINKRLNKAKSYNEWKQIAK